LKMSPTGKCRIAVLPRPQQFRFRKKHDIKGAWKGK
jgi:hypothetical protein